jgi:SagB-type dehydrogenase family enzyme
MPATVGSLILIHNATLPQEAQTVMTRAELMQLLTPADVPDLVWELFHENSKAGRYDTFPSPDFVARRMERMLESLAFDHYPQIDLPLSRATLDVSLAEAITSRVTARGLAPCSLSIEQLATLLYYAYGITRDNRDTSFPRPFRTVPSGGALYPLELFFHSTHVESLEAGLYHYNPAKNCLRFLRYGDESRRLSEALVQRNLALDTSLIIFITAVFERSVFKYGDRGYRFALLEAGHVAQNLSLAATGLGLGCVSIGGYADRQIDDLLGLDGVFHSTIYLIGIGQPDAAGAQHGPRLGH